MIYAKTGVVLNRKHCSGVTNAIEKMCMFDSKRNSMISIDLNVFKKKKKIHDIPLNMC